MQLTTSVSQAHSPETAPTWLEVYAHWVSLKVPAVKVFDFNPAVHDENVAWFEYGLPHSERLGLFSYLQSPPRADTARVIANKISHEGPSTYALFAMLTTIRQLDEWTPLEETLRVEADRRLPQIRNVWGRNARHVLPCDVIPAYAAFREDKDWRLRVELAADVWKELAARFHVVRLPL